MSQGTSPCRPTGEVLRDLYAPVQDELDQVEAILRGELHSDFPFVDGLVQHGFQLGGKRLRPALVLLSGLACGPLGREHPILGAVVELIHTATLIHDDVLDEALVRRHLQTINSRFGNEASVLLGDYLFARAICLAAQLDSLYVCRIVSDAVRIMCEGELRQVGMRGRFDLSEAEYLEIVAAKTAELCACCCRLGSHFAGAEDGQTEILARYGRGLGIAFQIVDDVLDVRGTEAVVGKSLGTDLAKQKPTLPIIRLLDQAGPSERGQVMDILRRSDDHQAEALAPWLARFDAIAYAQEQAVLHVRRAQEELDALSPSTAREALKRLADFVVVRNL
jgi:octaprenyl-diphosphate synthase